MATIKKKKRKNSLRRQERQKLYQLKQWRDLSKQYRMEHPLCERCLAEGRTKESQQVHHLVSPFEWGLSEEEKLKRLLNPNNLQALCVQCHVDIHKEKDKKKKTEEIDESESESSEEKQK